ncbi:MAG: MarR family transcriptional regulator [Bacteroidales bacterium]|nr:MarR family transcriptional regulator [Bacteroidales bacterium]
MSFYRDTGLLILGTRLRRISEKFLNDVAVVYKTQGIDFETSWFPILYLLYKKGPQTLTDIARELEITHSAVSQMTGAIQSRQLVLIQSDNLDARKKVVLFSKKGHVLIEQAKPLWQALEKNLHSIFPSNGEEQQFLHHLDFLESRFEKKNISEKTLDLIKSTFPEIKIKIPNFAKDPKIEEYIRSGFPDFNKNQNAINFIALQNDQYVGFLNCTPEPENLTIHYLYTSQKSRGRGIAGLLLKTAWNKFISVENFFIQVYNTSPEIINLLVKSGYPFKVN